MIATLWLGFNFAHVVVFVPDYERVELQEGIRVGVEVFVAALHRGAPSLPLAPLGGGIFFGAT